MDNNMENQLPGVEERLADIERREEALRLSDLRQ